MRKRRQTIYAVLPLLLLLLCLGLVNLLPDDLGGTTAVTPPSPIIPTSQNGGGPPLLALTTPAPPSPTPTPTVTPTATPLPTLPPEAQITLLGPPDGSVLPASAAISLFWTWPLALREGESLVVYLLLGDEERPLSPLIEPNMGRGYYWQLPPAELSSLGDEFRWQVRLESETGPPLRLSETRAIRLLNN
jgi:hypothetical protein